MNEGEEKPREKRDGCCSGILLGVVVLVVLMGVAMYFLNRKSAPDNKGSQTLLSRLATNSDIMLETKEDISFGFSFTVTPSVDIKGLEITFTFMNSSNSVLNSVVKTVGTVVKGREYSVSVSFDDLGGWLTALSVAKYTYSVTAGTVSYFS